MCNSFSFDGCACPIIPEVVQDVLRFRFTEATWFFETREFCERHQYGLLEQAGSNGFVVM
jgi:hypothetical protein